MYLLSIPIYTANVIKIRQLVNKLKPNIDRYWSKLAVFTNITSI